MPGIGIVDRKQGALRLFYESWPLQELSYGFKATYFLQYAVIFLTVITGIILTCAHFFPSPHPRLTINHINLGSSNLA